MCDLLQSHHCVEFHQSGLRNTQEVIQGLFLYVSVLRLFIISCTGLKLTHKTLSQIYRLRSKLFLDLLSNKACRISNLWWTVDTHLYLEQSGLVRDKGINKVLWLKLCCGNIAFKSILRAKKHHEHTGVSHLWTGHGHVKGNKCLLAWKLATINGH